MNLKFKKPSKETQLAMSRVAVGEDSRDYHSLSEEKLVNATNHDNAKLVSSGSAAIMAVMNSIDGSIIVPNQGAWNGFKQIANFLNKDLIIVNTNQGLLTTNHLKETLTELSQKTETDSEDKNSKSALFLTSFAGYTAEQNIKEISDFAHKNNILLVEDASGGICDSKERLANGKYSDIIIGSTGSPKIINVEDGGFITSNDKGIFDKSKLLLKTSKASNITACGIFNEIDFAGDNLDKTIDACSYLKEKIENETYFDVVHSKKRGINIIIKSGNPKALSYKLRYEFRLDSHGMITKCPNYNRLKEKAVAIEIKNLDIDCLNHTNLDKMVDILKNHEDLA